jgi:FixJ family two-component response regulator
MMPLPLLPPRNILVPDGTHGSECIITDVQMPGMTGIALQDRLIADGYRRPIIFMSALSAEDAGAEVLRTAASLLKIAGYFVRGLSTLGLGNQ